MNVDAGSQRVANLGTIGDTLGLTFLGGGGTVMGSKHLLALADDCPLVDCGLFQGFKQLRLRKREPFPVPPASIAQRC